MAKIAINGFGRIGRIFFRQAHGVQGIDILAINDLGDPENLAYLLSRDSVYGTYDKQVIFTGGMLKVGRDSVEVLSEKDPAKLPWGKLGVDIVIESTRTPYRRRETGYSLGARKGRRRELRKNGAHGHQSRRA
jgi:glyceraldehyde 3-phosphate dehydrogenase